MYDMHKPLPDSGLSFVNMQIADDIKPHPIVISILSKLSKCIPTWRVIPTPDITDVANRDPLIRKEVNFHYF